MILDACVLFMILRLPVPWPGRILIRTNACQGKPGPLPQQAATTINDDSVKTFSRKYQEFQPQRGVEIKTL
jgi:hypothetical protein